MDPEKGGRGPGGLLGIVNEGKLFRHLFETSPNAIVLLDEKGIVRECNVWTKYLTGYARDDLVGKVFLDMPFLTDTALAQVVQKYRELQSSESGELDSPLDVQIRKRDGSLKWVSLMGTIITVDGRTVMQVIAVDVEARKKLELVLEDENKALKALDELRKQFVTDATHELKTPLTSVDGAAQLLDDNYSSLDPDAIKNLVKLVRRGSFRLKELIELLLDFSRIEAGHLSLKIASDDLVPVIHDAVNGVRFLADQRHHCITVKTLPKLHVNIDKSRIEQVVVNLLTNAVKNTPPGGVIEVAAVHDRERAIVSIKDTGIGITKEEIGKLFTKFGKIDRTDSSAEINVHGSGLGLFISMEIVHQHGGKIWAESEGRMKGSTFSFTLPLAPGYD
jgi:PAS domain S-box-containing protein